MIPSLRSNWAVLSFFFSVLVLDRTHLSSSLGLSCALDTPPRDLSPLPYFAGAVSANMIRLKDEQAHRNVLLSN